MGLLRPEELEQLVCGRTELDFAALQAAARYDSGFTPDTPVRSRLEALRPPCPCSPRSLPAFVRVCSRGMAKYCQAIQGSGPGLATALRWTRRLSAHPRCL